MFFLSKINMILVLVGSPFSGKTTLLKRLQEHGVKVFHADSFVHNMYKKGEKGYEIIKENFGKEFVDENSVNRIKLRDYLVNNPDKLTYLNEIIHPLIADYLKDKDNYVAELPIIKNTPVKFKYDKLILVKASKEEIINRSKRKNNQANHFIDDLIKKWDNNFGYDYVVDTTNGISEEIIQEIIKKYKLLN